MEQYRPYLGAELITRISEGDEQAFSELFVMMVPLLRPGIMKLLRSEEVFKEILQEAFVKVWLHRDQLPAIEKPERWIYRITANECFTWLNKEARRPQVAKYFTGEESSDQPTPDQYLTIKETRQVIHTAISLLPERKKEIYMLSRSQGLKTEEIASKLHISPGYVRNAISEALEFIRQHLTRAGHLLVIAAIFK